MSSVGNAIEQQGKTIEQISDHLQNRVSAIDKNVSSSHEGGGV
jgi:hypothetical protein